MKLILTLITALLLAPLDALHAADVEHPTARIELLNSLWRFNSTQPAQSTLTAQAPQAGFAAPADATRGFTVKLAVNLKQADREKEILSMPGVLRVCLRPHDPRDCQLQNYPAFPMRDGTVPVLEAAVMLYSTQFPEGKEMTIGIPPGLGWRVYSGSALMDYGNVSGLREGAHPPILLFYSQDGRAATALAYSVDGGKTFRQYDKNPLFQTRHPWGHDPKVAWYEPEQKWVMVIHDFADERNERWGYDFYESKNLLEWKYLSTAPDCWETPDFFQLPLDGDRARMQWVLHECSAAYQIGDFNGRKFAATTEKQKTFSGNALASYTFENAPDGRRIQLGATNNFNYFEHDPSLPLRGGITIPMEVTLRTSPTGPRLYLNPVKEIETLVSAEYRFERISIGELADKLSAIKPGLFDIEFEWDAAQQKDFRLNIWDREIFAFNAKDTTYSVDGQKRKVAPVKGSIKVRLICDRSICTYFINDGYEAGNRYVGGWRPEGNADLRLVGEAGQTFKSFRVCALRPIWSTTVK